MLVAYGPSEQLITANETPLERLRQWSQEHLLVCPNCRGVLHVRGGPERRMQLHFAHRRGECEWSSEAETVRHMRGKIALAEWLRTQFPQASVTLEERLPGPNRIADVFVKHADGHCQAIEFQCASLDAEEWKNRHRAYREAAIIDTWVMGENRREKQDAFVESVLAMAGEALFLDALADVPRAWLRWPATREMIQAWQHETALRPLFEGWVGHLGYGVTLVDALAVVRLNRRGMILHPRREGLDARARLLRKMADAQTIDESTLIEYMRASIGEAAIQDVIIPLLHAYRRDPDLLRRYHYGRGQYGEDDRQRVERARAWLKALAGQGYDAEGLRALAKAMPFVGAYAALAGYLEMLIASIY